MSNTTYAIQLQNASGFLTGARIFPIRTDTKKPIFAGWQKAATSDPAQLAAWAEEYPGCAWAIACAESGLIGVEVDPKARRSVKDKDSEQAGFERAGQAWRDLCASWGLPANLLPHIRSRSGGWHYYFKPKTDVDVKALVQRGLVKLPGFQQFVIETRVNGFLLIPPSEFDGRAYTRWPGGPNEPYDAPPQLIEALLKRGGEVGDTPPASIVKPGSYELKPFVKYVAKLNHTVGMPHHIWVATIYGMVAQYGRSATHQICHRICDGSPETNYQINDLVGRARETFQPGDSTLNTLFKYAHDNGISEIVPKSASAMFGFPAPPLDIDAILAEIDAEATPPPAVVSPSLVPAAAPASAVSLMVRGDAVPADTEDSLALSFAAMHAEDLRHVEEWGRWLQWDGVRWTPDKTSGAYNMIREHLRTFASGMAPQDARKIATAKTVAAVERMSRADRRIATLGDIWDADPMLLNTPYGVVDLVTGNMRPAQPSDHMTKITAVAPGGDCPIWRSFLHKSLAGDAELIAFIQRMLGYALTGDTREHALFFLFGPGGNGKGVLLNTVAGILGDYSKTAAIETFIDSPHERHSTDLAGLRGARLVSASETEKGRRWAEAKIKTLTGGDRISARFMRQDFFEYVPQFKLVIAGNHKPGLRSVDEAIRRRFNLVPFTVKIPKGERDPSLPERLKAEWPGILAWLIEGCLAWQRGGLQQPAAVRDATEEYLSGEDALKTWMDERCVAGPDTWASRQELFSSWKIWAEGAREYVGTLKDFLAAMRSAGFEEAKSKQGNDRGFRGIKPKPFSMPFPMSAGFNR
jgi:putative DNA primase/helicase